MAKKLPRRTMSMSKRASNTAQAAADVDLVESVVGKPKGKGARKRPIAFTDYIGAWLAAVVGIVAIVGVLHFLFDSEGADFNPTGALPREQPAERFYQRGDNEEPQGSHSPFPEPRSVDPIILEVACPAGTVHIATGKSAADSICVEGQLADFSPAGPQSRETAPAQHQRSEPTNSGNAAPSSPFPTVEQEDPIIVGDTVIPPLQCQEDEVIDATGQCVHIDTFCPEGWHVGASETCTPPATAPAPASNPMPVTLPDTGGR